MKCMILVIIAVLSATGFAAAWDETNTLNYQYVKAVNTQADENLDMFDLTNSGAQFSEPNGAYGTQNATISNTMLFVAIAPATVDGEQTDTHDVLTQGGSAVTYASSPNPEASSDIKESGTATGYQDMHLSGAYADAGAIFDTQADVSVGGFSGHTVSSPDQVFFILPVLVLGTPFLISDPRANFDTVITEIDMGQEASVGVQKLQAAGADPTLSGSFTQWGGFSGAYDLVPGEEPFVSVFTIGEQDFWMTK